MTILRSLAVLTLVTCGIAASGCSPTASRGLESVHQPVVSRTDYVFDVSAPGHDRLAPSEAERLDGWFRTINLRFGDRVWVDAPGGDPGARAAVADVSARYGLLVEDRTPETGGDIPPGAMRVVVSRMTATVPNCPDFSRLSNPQFSGSQSSNYGCAMNSNFAAMVADPGDLIAGREGSGTVDAATSTKAIKAYRLAPVTGTNGLKIEATKTGGN